LEQINWIEVEQYFNTSKAIRIIYKSKKNTQAVKGHKFELKPPKISDKNLHRAIINPIVFQKRSSFFNAKNDIILKMNDAYYLINPSYIKSILNRKVSYWEMYENHYLVVLIATYLP
jgi:hypothetical protein